MKKSLLVLASLVFATTSFAQAPAATTTGPAATHLPTHRVTRPDDLRARAHQTPEQRADHHTAMLTKRLNLSADQQPKVHQILLAQAQEAQALKAKYPGQDQHQARHQEMKAGHAKYQAQLQSVLSADQYGKLQALRQEHHRGEHGARLKAKS